MDSKSIRLSRSDLEGVSGGTVRNAGTFSSKAEVEQYLRDNGYLAEGQDMNSVVQGWNSVSDRQIQGRNLILGDQANDNMPASYIGGTNGNDLIISFGTTNYIDAGAGDDIIFGSNGNDIISGNSGDDMIFGGNGDDRLNGGDGGDIIFAGNGNDTVFGGTGNDVLLGEDGNDLMLGGDGDDVILGSNGDDHLEGHNGNDAIDGGNGNDTITGNAGSDNLFGNSGNDVITRDSNDNNVNGGAGNNTIGYELSGMPAFPGNLPGLGTPIGDAGHLAGSPIGLAPITGTILTPNVVDTMTD